MGDTKKLNIEDISFLIIDRMAQQDILFRGVDGLGDQGIEDLKAKVSHGRNLSPSERTAGLVHKHLMDYLPLRIIDTLSSAFDHEERIKEHERDMAQETLPSGGKPDDIIDHAITMKSVINRTLEEMQAKMQSKDGPAR